jgi:hypothetical protein
VIEQRQLSPIKSRTADSPTSPTIRPEDPAPVTGQAIRTGS